MIIHTPITGGSPVALRFASVNYSEETLRAALID